MAYRRIERPGSHDEGPTVEVYGREGDELHEVLKFDCFEQGPHWHRCRPDQKDEIATLEVGSMDDALDFAIATLRDRFQDLVREQGYDHLATADRMAELSEVLPAVEHRLRTMIHDRGPVQVVHLTS